MASRVIQKDRDVISNVGLVELEDPFALGMVSVTFPTRDTTRVDDKPKLFACGFDSEMFNVCAGQPASANEAIARRTRPAYFNKKHPHAVG